MKARFGEGTVVANVGEEVGVLRSLLYEDIYLARQAPKGIFSVHLKISRVG